MKKLFLIYLFYISWAAQAQDTLFRASVNQVMELPVIQKEEETVTTASKKAESVLAAPAAMTVITAKEIEAFGALNLHQVLDRVTSMYTTNIFAFPDGHTVMRGTNSTFDVHSLILINGRPIRENYGGIKDVYNIFPLQSLEKIEIIRGSGSVLYGSNAYTCVINLITKKAQENLELHTSLRYGSFQTWQSQIGLSKKIKDLSINFYGNYFKTEGWQFTGRGDADMKIENGKEIALNPPKTINMQREGYATFLKTDFKNFHFQHYFSQNILRSMSSQITIWTPYWGKVSHQENYIDLGYENTWKNLTLQTNLNYSYFLRNIFGENTPNENRFAINISKTWLGELYLQYRFSEKLHIGMGGTWANIDAKGLTVNRDASGMPFDWLKNYNPNPYATVDNTENWYNAYFQADYQVFDFLKMDIGGQLNKAGNSPINFVPRINLVATWKNSFFAKLIYGQAFRSANMLERYTNIRTIHSQVPIALVGDKNLLPETITTSEAQIAYKGNKIQLTAGYFNSFQENLITSSSPTDSLVIANAGEIGKKLAIPKQINRGTLRSEGIEIEAKTTGFKNFYLTSSFSIFDIEKDKSTGMPQMMFKLGFVYDIPQIGIQFGIFNSYFGKNEIIKTRFLMANPEVKPYNFMTLNLNWNLKKMYEGARKKPEIILNFYVNNLLNEQIYYPEYTRRVINSIQGRAERAFYLELKFGFGK